MKFDYLKDKKDLVAKVLLGVSAVLVILTLVKAAGFFVASASAKRLVKDAVAQSKPDANDMEKYFAKSRTIAGELKQKNLFAPPPPRQHPVKQVWGIFGDEVLIEGKWYKVGDTVGDAKIVAIEPAQVKIEWEGKEKSFSPFDAKSAAESKKRAEKSAAKRGGRREMPMRPVKKAVEEKVSAPSEEEDPLAWMGVKLSPAARAKMLEAWNKMSDEQKEKMKERWNNMSDEEKQKAADEIEKNV